MKICVLPFVTLYFGDVCLFVCVRVCVFVCTCACTCVCVCVSVFTCVNEHSLHVVRYLKSFEILYFYMHTCLQNTYCQSTRCRKVLPFDNLFTDPPPAVNFTAVQSFNEIVISWNNVNLLDEPCPITSYNITINGSPVTVGGNGNKYTHSIVDECGSALEISMFAISAAGPGKTTTTNLPIVTARKCCSIDGFKVCSLVDWHQSDWALLPLQYTF